MMVDPRPTRSSPEVRDAAIRAIAAVCDKWATAAGDQSDMDGWLRGLNRVSNLEYGNGYEIAKSVENACYCSPDEELVEILASASSHFWRAEEAAVKAWVERNGITLDLPVGARAVSPRHGEGRINGHRAETATYLFVPDSEGNPERFSRGGGYVLTPESLAQVPA